MKKILAPISALLILGSCVSVKMTALEQIADCKDGMFFSTEYVVETFHYGETAWYMTYDDIDAGFDNEVIRLDKASFDIIEGAKADGLSVEGELYMQRDYETTLYTLTITD